MITCRECRERLYDDPRVPTGRYRHNGCDYFCNKSSYDREIEEMITNQKEQPVKEIVRRVYEKSREEELYK